MNTLQVNQLCDEFYKNILELKAINKAESFWAYNFDPLGERFLTEEKKSNRLKLGQFFTPKLIVNYLLDKSGFSYGKKIIDLSCGSGRFLIEAVTKMIKAGASLDEILDSIYGFDIDERLVKIAQTNIKCLLISYGYSFNKNSKINIFCEDTLNNKKIYNDIKNFDIVIGNPPYFKTTPKNNLGHPNSYAVFFELGIKVIKKNGYLSYIIPKSFTSGLYFKKLRSILKELEVIEIITIKDRTGLFEGVLQELVLITVKNQKPKKDYTFLTGTAKTNNLNISSVNISSDIAFNQLPSFLLPENKIDVNILNKIFNQENKNLESFELKVSTGPIVAFRMCDFLSNTLLKGYLPVYWPHNFVDGKFTKENTSKKNRYIGMKRNSSNEKYVLSNPSIVIKRISSKEQNKRIDASILRASNEYSLENHLNYILFPSKKRKLLKPIYNYVNSLLWEYLFRIINGNTQVSASELKILPISNRSFELINLGKNQNDNDILKSFNLSSTEISHISSIVTQK